MGAHLRINRLVKSFGDGKPAVDHVSLEVPKGEILALLGPSGSGKTTTLRLVAGFEPADSGSIEVDGLDVTTATPLTRRFGMVFQHYALFPHLDVGRNVAFGLESQGLRGNELASRVSRALALVDLTGFDRRRIGELSGGQQQRVALARALAPEPRVLLLDEPLSNLDPSLRERTRLELKELVRRTGTTTVFVTHEQEEAFALGDRIALLRAGRLEQAGTAEELYDSPTNEFVTQFIGRASTLSGSSLSPRRVRVGPAEWISSPEASGNSASGDGRAILVRPEALHFTEPAEDRLSGEVTHRRFTGAQTFFTLETCAGVVEVSADSSGPRVGDRVGLAPRGDGRGIHVFPKESAS